MMGSTAAAACCWLKVSKPPPKRRLEDNVQMNKELPDVAANVGEGDVVVTGDGDDVVSG
jgi:hypothetical protein